VPTCRTLSTGRLGPPRAPPAHWPTCARPCLQSGASGRATPSSRTGGTGHSWATGRAAPAGDSCRADGALDQPPNPRGAVRWGLARRRVSRAVHCQSRVRSGAMFRRPASFQDTTLRHGFPSTAHNPRVVPEEHPACPRGVLVRREPPSASVACGPSTWQCSPVRGREARDNRDGRRLWPPHAVDARPPPAAPPGCVTGWRSTVKIESAALPLPQCFLRG